MRPAAFLKYAEQQLAAGTDPARQRTIISRAYYAVHHCGRQYLADQGIVIARGPQAHQAVGVALRHSPDVTVRK